jgi:mono/diheme cytochrome c family protein
MPGYRFQVNERDRWAIIAYVRALQRAASGTVADVPAELRSELR